MKSLEEKLLEENKRLTAEVEKGLSCIRLIYVAFKNLPYEMTEYVVCDQMIIRHPDEPEYCTECAKVHLRPVEECDCGICKRESEADNES